MTNFDHFVQIEQFIDRSGVEPRRMVTFILSVFAIRSQYESSVDTSAWRICNAKGEVVLTSRKRIIGAQPLPPGKYVAIVNVRLATPGDKTPNAIGIHKPFTVPVIPKAKKPSGASAVKQPSPQRPTKTRLAAFSKDVYDTEGVVMEIVPIRGADTRGAITGVYSEKFKKPLKDRKNARVRDLRARIAEIVDLTKFELAIFDGLLRLSEGSDDRSIKLKDLH